MKTLVETTLICVDWFVIVNVAKELRVSEENIKKFIMEEIQNLGQII